MSRDYQWTREGLHVIYLELMESLWHVPHKIFLSKLEMGLQSEQFRCIRK